MKLLSYKVVVVVCLFAMIFGISIATAFYLHDVYVYEWEHEGDYELVAATDVRVGAFASAGYYEGRGGVYVQVNSEPAVRDAGTIWAEVYVNGTCSTGELKVRTSCNPWDMKYVSAQGSMNSFTR